MKQLQPLRAYFQGQRAGACEVAAGPIQAGDKSKCYWVACCEENDWNCRGRSFQRQRRRSGERRNDGYSTTNQIGCQRRQLIVAALRPTIFYRQILALDIAGFLQALTESTQAVFVQVRRIAAQKSDHGHRRLLRARRERPRRRAAEQRDELAAGAHSITSSARASSLSEIGDRASAVCGMGLMALSAVQKALPLWRAPRNFVG